jgi:DNA-3-methyladenine glycosylase
VFERIYHETHMTGSKKLTREFYTRGDTLRVARELLGQLLVVPAEDGERVSALIVETEAYCAPLDKASHAYANRRTPRTESMYGLGGTAYVYFIYGMYYQFNVVTNEAETPHAVLVRAVEPVEGLDVMRQRRPVKTDVSLTSGPGKLCIAMGIDRSLDRADLLGERVWIEEGERIKPRMIASGPRVGIAYAEEYVSKPWRFWIAGNPFVSRR